MEEEDGTPLAGIVGTQRRSVGEGSAGVTAEIREAEKAAGLNAHLGSRRGLLAVVEDRNEEGRWEAEGDLEAGSIFVCRKISNAPWRQLGRLEAKCFAMRGPCGWMGVSGPGDTP